MSSIRRHIKINRPADDVWAVIADPTSITDWFPGVVECYLDGDTRMVTTAIDITLPEEIVTIDPVERRFQYRIKSPMIRFHLGTIDVFELDDESCLVAYSTDCDPDAMGLIIGGASGAALTELRRRLEAKMASAATAVHGFA